MIHSLIHILIALVFVMPSFTQTKRALLVGISKYSDKYSWNAINGRNDVMLMKEVLEDFNCVKLCDSKATHHNITRKLNNLLTEAKEGDIIYLHFSGHGQPVEDVSSDEKDGWDEAFVPFDAGQIYGENGYKGNRHILDDDLGAYIYKIRKKIGSKGFLYVVIDACHSGTMSREDNTDIPDEDDSPIRGTNIGFSEHKIYKPKREKTENHYLLSSSVGMSDVIIFEACGAMQRNQEIKVGTTYYGPLTYSINNVIRRYGWGKNLKWIENVKHEMKRNIPSWSNQEMVVETSIKK